MVSERSTGEVDGAEEAKVAAAESGTMSGPLVGMITRPIPLQTKGSVMVVRDVGHVALRVMCMLTSLIALSFMVTAKEDGTVSIYGFQFPVHSKWSFSHAFEYVSHKLYLPICPYLLSTTLFGR
jgi:hypothetical protein